MWLRNPLDDILSSRAKVAVLRVVCASNIPLSGREIARRAGVSSGNASRVLRELTASGVLTSRDQGRVHTYELADTDIALVKQLRELFEVEADRRQRAIADLVRGVPEVLSVVLFGSEARGEAAPGSDTDLLIVVGRKVRGLDSLLVDKALKVAEKHGVPLSWHTVDLAELRRWEKTAHPLWQNILAEGVPLRGASVWGLRRQCQRGRTV